MEPVKRFLNLLKGMVLMLFFCCLSSQYLFAAHFMGGEITWECRSNGKYVFFLKIYRNCQSNDVSLPTDKLNVHNNPGIINIPLDLISVKDISPVCNVYAQPSKISCTGKEPGSVEEKVYVSQEVTLNGIPPAEGWIFTWSGTNRSDNITNLTDSGSKGYTLRAKMFSYNNQPANPCFDNSPSFSEKPSTIICTGYDFTYNNNAIDQELDSLNYSWDFPLDKLDEGIQFSAIQPPSLSFSSGYSYNNPLPGPALNPLNKGAIIKSETGEISYTSFTNGTFATVVKVSSYKGGKLIAEIFRDLQVVLLQCETNYPPNVTPPFPDLVDTTVFTRYSDTVKAGELVEFNIAGSDNELLLNGEAQTIEITASGAQFGTGFSDPGSGCLNPPCATLTPPPPITGTQSVSTKFSWQTNCNHISFVENYKIISNTYTFVIKVSDDFCPAPAVKIATISITVIAEDVINPPSLRCTSVEPNGKIKLSWIPVVDTAGLFNSYHIYRSNSSSGPFVILDSIFSINQSEYMDLTADPINQTYYYFIKIRSGCFGKVLSSASDTLQVIKPKLINNKDNFGRLSWNGLHEPLPATSLGAYKIEREYPPGTWTQVFSTSGLSYDDPVFLCNDTLNYKIYLEDSSGCRSNSNIIGSRFIDSLAPDRSVIDSLSINSFSGFPVLSWIKSPAPDAIGYVIYLKTGLFSERLDTVLGVNNLTYSETRDSLNGNIKSIKYRVAVFDSCKKESQVSVFHNTIFLKSKFDFCNSNIELKWNPYQNWPGGIENYFVMVSENGADFYLAATTTDTTYKITPVKSFTNYCFKIVARQNLKATTVSSNRVCIFTDPARPPEDLYIRKVTVLDNKYNFISILTDENAEISEYQILRSSSPDTGFKSIREIPGNYQAEINIVDSNVDVSSKIYYYKINAIDKCNNLIMQSNVSGNILLYSKPDFNLSYNNVYWSGYKSWPGGVGEYNLFRSIDGAYSGDPVAVLDSSILKFNDDITGFTESNGGFCYYIEAIEDSGNKYNFAETSRSNISCLFQEPSIYVPNAFIPEGVTNIFKPVLVFEDPSDYHFMIFSRWGEIIFETKNTENGWDGKARNGEIMEGVFVYSIHFKARNGLIYKKRGTVTILN